MHICWISSEAVEPTRPSWARPGGCFGLHKHQWLCSGCVLPSMPNKAPPAGSGLAGIHAERCRTSHGLQFLILLELNSCFTSLAQQRRVRSSPDIYRTALSLIACLGLVYQAIKAPLVRSSLGTLAGLPHAGRQPAAVRTRTAHSNHFPLRCSLGSLTQSGQPLHELFSTYLKA